MNFSILGKLFALTILRVEFGQQVKLSKAKMFK
jgi:hypothetical protein